MQKIKLLFWTVVYLRPQQIIWRILRRFYRPPLLLNQIPPRANVSASLIKPIPKPTSMIGPDQFVFLNNKKQVASFDGIESDSASKLWKYNLHYFDDLNAIDSERRFHWHQVLINKWIAETIPGSGIGWEPYPLSLRIVNWIKWILAGNNFEKNMLDSLAIQSRWLNYNIEYHLLGNHLFSNAKALIFSGLFFDGDEANDWLATGCKILENELDEQILADGGQFELSPMYHALALEDILDLINILSTYQDSMPSKYCGLLDRLKDKVPKMCVWLHVMSHPDGEISFFNDAAMGVAPKIDDVIEYAIRLGFHGLKFNHENVERLSDSGYIRLNFDKISLFLDTAKIGPDYLPAHAHADTLSYELSLNGKRFIVNTGTSRYGVGQQRIYERSTAAHNTVVIDEQNSSEVWSGFRVARRAKPSSLSIAQKKKNVHVSCQHNGYKRLKGRCVHKRSWSVSCSKLIVIDDISGRFTSAYSVLHFHPDVKLALSRIDNGNWKCHAKNLCGDELLISIEGAGDCCIEPSKWCPRFGEKHDNEKLRVKFLGRQLQFKLMWN